MPPHRYKSWFFHIGPLEGLTAIGLNHKRRAMTYLIKVWGKDEIRM